MKARTRAETRTLLHGLWKILKYLASAFLALVAVGAFGLAGVVRFGSPGVTTLLVLLGAWCIGSVWFLHFRRRVSAATRRGLAVGLALFPFGFWFAWANLARLQTYLGHRDWLTYRSEHFIFHYATNYPRANEIDSFAGVRDQAFTRNCAYLKVSLKGRTDFYVHENLDEGFAVPDWNVIFADDDQSIGHEMTHIIAYHIAGHRQKIRLLDEGIATWLNHTTRAADHHRVAWEYLQTNGLPPLNQLAQSRTFRRHRPPPYYPAASFVGYLVENHGVDAFRRLWTANAGYPELYSNLEDLKLTEFCAFVPGERAHLESTVREVYGRPLNELDTEWRAWLERRHAQ